MSESKFEVQASPEYRTIICNQLFGGFRNGQFEFELISENIDLKPSLASPQVDVSKAALQRVMELKLIIGPVTLKTWLTYLQTQLNQYESIFGTINIPAQPVAQTDTGKATTGSPIGSQYT